MLAQRWIITSHQKIIPAVESHVSRLPPGIVRWTKAARYANEHSNYLGTSMCRTKTGNALGTVYVRTDDNWLMMANTAIVHVISYVVCP